jgi:hypothetical protein
MSKSRLFLLDLMRPNFLSDFDVQICTLQIAHHPHINLNINNLDKFMPFGFGWASDRSALELPDSIPNSAVKRGSADDSCGATHRKNRSLLVLSNPNRENPCQD